MSGFFEEDQWDYSEEAEKIREQNKEKVLTKEQERERLCKLAGIPYEPPVKRKVNKFAKRCYNTYQDIRHIVMFTTAYVLVRVGLIHESTFLSICYYGHKGHKK